MFKNLTTPFCFLFLFFSAGHQFPLAAQPVSLSEAITRALNNNPALAATSFQIDAARGQVSQARLRPNPEIGIEFEKFAGNSEFSGTSVLENSVSLSQEFVTGGKRGLKVKMARIDLELARLENELARRELLEKVANLYIQIFCLNRLIEIEKQFVNLSERNLGAVEQKVTSGEMPPIDATRAKVEAVSAKTDLGKMLREKETLLYELSATWNSTSTDFSISESIDEIPSLPEFSEELLEQMTERLTEVKIARLRLDLARAGTRLEKAAANPNFSLEGGITRERDGNKHHYFIGLSVPLPIFDRNQGNRSSASAREYGEKKTLQQAILSMRTRLIELFKKYESVTDELETAEKMLVPAAKEAFEQMQKAFESGERELFELFDAHKTMLKAQKTLVQLQAERLEFLLDISLKTANWQLVAQNQEEAGN